MPTNFSRETEAEDGKIGAKFIFKKYDLTNSLGSKQGNVLGFCIKIVKCWLSRKVGGQYLNYVRNL